MTQTRDTGLRRERNTVIMIFVVTTIALLVLVFLFLIPLRNERSSVAEEITRVRQEFHASYQEFHRVPLRHRVSAAKRRHMQLQLEWEELRARVDGFRGRPALFDTVPTYEDGRIDFKVALFEADQLLRERAAAANVVWPEGLVVPETIGTDERAETRLWQLAAMVKLLDEAVAVGVSGVTAVEALPPLRHDLLEQESEVAVEFPVCVTLECPFDRMLTLLQAVLSEGKFFAIRRMRVERRGKDATEPLRMTMLCGAILFQLRDEIEEALPTDDRPTRRGRLSREARP